VRQTCDAAGDAFSISDADVCCRSIDCPVDRDCCARAARHPGTPPRGAGEQQQAARGSQCWWLDGQTHTRVLPRCYVERLPSGAPRPSPSPSPLPLTLLPLRIHIDGQTAPRSGKPRNRAELPEAVAPSPSPGRILHAQFEPANNCPFSVAHRQFWALGSRPHRNVGRYEVDVTGLGHA
jgi:hypothetical protein